jgi:hypothetical protein
MGDRDVRPSQRVGDDRRRGLQVEVVAEVLTIDSLTAHPDALSRDYR